MKNLMLFFIAIFWGGSLQALEKDSLFEAANRHYAAKEYEAAQQLYDSIYQAGFENAALHYNLANSYYQLGQTARAILHYERSLRLNPSDEEAQHNLDFARQKTVDRFEELPLNLFQSFWQGLLQLFSPDAWARSALLFLLLGVLGLALYFFSPQQRLGFAVLVIGVSMALFSLALAWQHQRFLENNRAVIVMDISAYAKNGPDEDAEDVFILHAGTKAKRLEAYQEWVKLKLPDGKRGWVKANSVEEI